MKDTLYILDSHSYIYRAFFAVRGLTNSQGLPTNAIYGFTKMLQNILDKKKPKYFVATLDSPGEVTERVEGYEDYKANRQPMPEDLRVQIPFIMKVLEGFNIPICMKEGIEADDLIACYVEFAKKEGIGVTIVTGDKDLMQLVDDEAGIVMWDTMKNKTYDRKGVKEKMGVYPESIPDLLGLMGDSSDNIPGVKGIGPKTAVSMLEKYPTLEGVYDHLEELVKGKNLEKMTNDKDMAFLSRQLATVHKELELPHTELDHIRLKEANYEELNKLFQELDFKNMKAGESNEVRGTSNEEKKLVPNPSSLAPIIVKDEVGINELIKDIKSEKELAFDTETDGTDPLNAKIVGLGLSTGKKTWYVDCNPKSGISNKVVVELVKEILKKKLIAHNAKFDLHILINNFQLPIANYELFDTYVAAFLLDPEGRRYKLKDVADKYLGEGKHNVKNYDEVVGKQDISEIDLNVLAEYCGEDTRASYELKSVLEKKLESEELGKISSEMEMPLVSVLTKMEEEGILVDEKKLALQGEQVKKKLDELEKEIYKIAGKEFNIASPAQLQIVLFEDLGLTPTKKTKTGYSTDEKVLNDLSKEHEVPSKILEYRHLAKLLSTYIEALPKQIDSKTGRVHTTYNQGGAVTGRFSSNNPNLQNIPVRTEEGSKIRQAFIADKGYKIFALDYSQIELRILAHETKEPGLLNAFKNGKDIHSETASIIFGKTDISREERSVAKTINFGLMYGMGPFKLAGELKISRSDARDFIDKYFEAFPGVKKWKEDYLHNVYEAGFAKSLMGRKRYFPNIRSSNKMMEEASKREAVNFVFQGTNADIIKKSMIEIDKYICENNLDIKMLLQVHDELVFEAKESDEKHIEKIKDLMEGVISIDVPIVVEIGKGDNWLEAH